jgi:hypothetical protein
LVPKIATIELSGEPNFGGIVVEKIRNGNIHELSIPFLQPFHSSTFSKVLFSRFTNRVTKWGAFSPIG